MIRAFLQEFALFLTPFLLYGVLLVLQRKHVLDVEHWSRAAFGLAVAGLSLAIGGLLYLGIFGETHTGEYVPPHMENGRPVQGGFR